MVETVDTVWLALISMPGKGEGLVAEGKGGQTMLMVLTDPVALDAFKLEAQRAAKEIGQPVTLCKFTGREVVETFYPQKH